MASSIPLAYNALVDLYSQALAPLQVVDAAQGTNIAADQLLVGDVIGGSQQPAELGRIGRRDETYAISCQVRVYTGTTADYRTVRARIFDLFALVENLHAEHPTLDDATGTIRWAMVEEIGLVQGPTGKGGSAAELPYTVRVQARTLAT